MIIDGVFLHHLVNELQEQLTNTRINKLIQIDNNSYLFSLQGKRKLYLNLNPDICHLRLTNTEYIQATKHSSFYSLLKKYLEGSLIKNLNQYENDRIITMEIEASDDLGFKSSYYLVIELFGKDANLFLLDNDFMILDCLKKSYLLDENNNRIFFPKMQYTYPPQTKINPFKTDTILSVNDYQGMSNLIYTEVIFRNDLSFLKEKPKPVLINTNKKIIFSCFSLTHLNGLETEFKSLSELLEEYYNYVLKVSTQNNDQKLLENYLKKEIAKIQKKIEKQEIEKQEAIKNLDLERIGNLLSANLHKVEKNSNRVIVEDFYNNNELVTIELDPKLSPTKNLDNIFNRYKKAKRAINLIDEQIQANKDELQYLLTLQDQLKIAKHQEIKEILEELDLLPKTEKQKNKKNKKIEIELFTDKNGNKIWVGKNNIQNNYLTHEFALKTDYFFHVKGIPGSHTIVRCKSLTPEVINLAANIAAYYSKARNSSNVAVDYTLVKYVKKVPKMKGSFVTYTNEKTVFVTPDLDFIKKNTI